MKALRIVLFLLLSACGSSVPLELKKGHRHFYGHPYWEDESLDLNTKKIVVVATQNFMGQLEPQEEVAANFPGKSSVRFKVGGPNVISAYYKVLREKYPHQLLLVDAGNFLPPEASVEQLEKVAQFYNSLSYDALIFGAHELSFQGIKGQDFTSYSHLQKLISTFKSPFVLGNLIDLKSGEPPSLKGASPILIKKVGGLKVGLTSVLRAPLPKEVRSGAMTGLYFDNHTKSALTAIRSLRAQGVQLIILITNIEQNCGEKTIKEHKLSIERVNFDPQDVEACSTDGTLSKFIKTLGKDRPDLIVAGGQEGKIANFISGVPVIRPFGKGRYLARAELYFDLNKNGVMSEKTTIHQPTKFCHMFFEESEDCFAEDPTIDHSKSTKAKFLGVEISPPST